MRVRIVNWSEKLATENIPAFTENTGPVNVLGRDKREVDFFRLLFPVGLLAWIANETNRFARQVQAVKGRDTRWTETNMDEICVFIGIRIYMSVVDLPDIKMYWSKDYLFGQFPIANVMTHDRFEKISQYFHANDCTQYNRNDPNHDKIFLVRPIFTIVADKCLEAYLPHKECSVDKAMIAFRGRLGFRQYMPAKPTKYGIKVWVRADSRSGFLNEFDVYVGKPPGKEREIGLGKKVVLKLTRNLSGKNHHVFFDNYFNSFELQEELLARRLFGCGTVRGNSKHLPIPMSSNKSKHGEPLKVKLNPSESKQWQLQSENGCILAVIWQEKKKRAPVCMLSSNTDPSLPLSFVKRKQRDGTSKEVPCPLPVVTYNEFMNGVDRSDQNRTKYITARRSRKWWTYLFWFLVDTCISNALILFNESPNHQKFTRTGRQVPATLLEFRKELAKQMIGDHREGRKRKRTEEADIHGGGHFSKHVKKKGYCAYYKHIKKKRPSESHYICEGCSEKSNIHLCLDPCFKKFHLLGDEDSD